LVNQRRDHYRSYPSKTLCERYLLPRCLGGRRSGGGSPRPAEVPRPPVPAGSATNSICTADCMF